MLSSLSDGIEGLTETEVAKGETVFTIGRLSPMNAYRFIDQCRERFGRQIDRINTIEIGGRTKNEVEKEAAKAIVQIFLKLPHEDVEFVRKAMFGVIEFRRPNIPTPIPVAGSEDTAFGGLDPGDIYEMTVRAFAVNFTGTFERILSKLPTETADTNPSSPD